jgi:hypothetical protein
MVPGSNHGYRPSNGLERDGGLKTVEALFVCPGIDQVSFQFIKTYIN